MLWPRNWPLSNVTARQQRHHIPFPLPFPSRLAEAIMEHCNHMPLFLLLVRMPPPQVIPHARYNLLRSRSFGLNLAPSHVLKSLGMQLYFLYELPRGLPCLRRKGESKM